ncbi:MAG: thiamine-phosphate kinase [Magnetococcales bacterium]|nr:thiamine-phosphate kinase [Magnetococcales bacterium]
MTARQESIASLGEFGLIRELFAPLQTPGVPGVVLGIGDDAAVLTPARTQELVITTDTLVEGMHFAADMDPYLLGRKTLLVNLSDLAAMGATPHWALLSLALPPATALHWAKEFARGLGEACRTFSVALVGGDTVSTTHGGTVITLTLMGMAGQGRAMTRKGATPGDLICVTGTIGDSALGLAVRQGRLKAEGDDAVFLTDRHQLPSPRVALGVKLLDAAIVRACIDVSDGFAADLGHLCEASGVAAEVDADRMPYSPAARRQLTRHGPEWESTLLSGGEDYELIFAMTEGAMEFLTPLCEETKTPVTVVGRFIEAATGEPRVRIRRGGELLRFSQEGWRHF